jgi:hypothetical protein
MSLQIVPRKLAREIIRDARACRRIRRSEGHWTGETLTTATREVAPCAPFEALRQFESAKKAKLMEVTGDGRGHFRFEVPDHYGTTFFEVFP